jgi:hypothetical protein
MRFLNANDSTRAIHFLLESGREKVCNRSHNAGRFEISLRIIIFPYNEDAKMPALSLPNEVMQEREVFSIATQEIPGFSNALSEMDGIMAAGHAEVGRDSDVVIRLPK